MQPERKRPQAREVHDRCGQDATGTGERAPYSPNAARNTDEPERHGRDQDIRADPQGTDESGAQQRSASEPRRRHGDFERQSVAVDHYTGGDETDRGDVTQQHGRHARMRCHEKVKNRGQQSRAGSHGEQDAWHAESSDHACRQRLR